MAISPQLSPRAAVIIGLFFIAAGIVPILGALGMLPLPPTPGTPTWVGVSGGPLFVLGGSAIIVGFAVAGGTGPDGDLPPATPLGVRLTQYVLGLAIYVLLTAIAGWVAFGKGERQFSTTLELPFLTRRGIGSEWMGRAAFGDSKSNPNCCAG